MINLIINNSVINKKQIVYVFYYLSVALDEELIISSHSKSECLNIYYSMDSESDEGIFIPSYNRDRAEVLEHIPYKQYMFTCFEKDVKNPYTVKDAMIYFNIDILSASFYLLSCGEEYEVEKRDAKGRFIAAFSQRKDNATIPFFDMNAKILCEAIQLLRPQIKKEADEFQVLLTHDVDNLDSRNPHVFLHNAKDLLRKNKRGLSVKIKKLVGEAVFNRFLQIKKCMSLEKRYGAKSEFYFILGKRHRFGRRYSIGQVQKQTDIIRSEGNFSVGLHTNYFSYNDEEKIKEEIKQVEALTEGKIKSCRNHYLRFVVPDTWIKLKNAGIVFDTTLGYSDKNGFRAGTVLSFIPFDVNKNQVISIFEIPLVIMDIVVMDKDNTLDEKFDEIKSVLDTVKEFNGTVSIIWHPCRLSDLEFRLMYERVLQYVKQIGGKFILTADLEKRFNEEKQEIMRLMDQLNIK